MPELLGHQCILSETAGLPTGGNHWLPGFTPPRPYSLIDYAKGTVLRVAHVERWDGPIDPCGNIVFADVQNGPHRGDRVVIGDLYGPYPIGRVGVLCVDPPILGVSAEAGSRLRPLRPEDAGWFYSGPFSRQGGMAYDIVANASADQ